MKKLLILLLSLLLMLSVGCKKHQDPVETPTENPTTDPSGANTDPEVDPNSTDTDGGDINQPGGDTDPSNSTNNNGPLINGVTDYVAPAAPELTWIENLEIPEYSGKAYVAINDNLPFFDLESLKAESYEVYYALDELGRCTLADAVLSLDTMATKSRTSISSVKPTGWHTDKYSFVDGESLYNRCHLIAHYLSDENANPYNLVTGTRYMNDDGMNAVENMIGDFIKETGYHVRYRVTPVWTGNNLICDGLLVEAYSIEDEGEGVCLNFFAYNVQPGVIIDYATGDNYADEGYEGKKESDNTPSYAKYLLEEDFEGEFVLNVKKNKIHTPDCEGAVNMAEKNREDYTGSYNALIERGFLPCETCNPQINDVE